MPQFFTSLFLAALFFVGTAAWTSGHDENGARRSFTDTVRVFFGK